MPYLRRKPTFESSRKEVIDLLAAFLIENGFADEGFVFRSANGNRFRGQKGHLPPWKELMEDLPGKCFFREQYQKGLTIVCDLKTHPQPGCDSPHEIMNVCSLTFYNVIRTDAPSHMIHLKCKFGHNLMNSMVDLHDPDSLDKLRRMIDDHQRMGPGGRGDRELRLRELGF